MSHGTHVLPPPSAGAHLMWQVVQSALAALDLRRNGTLVVSCGLWQVPHSTWFCPPP